MMRWIGQLRLRLRSLLDRNRVELELGEELRFHLEQQVEENLAAGMNRKQAREHALRSIGGIAQIAEQCRDAWRLNLMDNFVKDVVYAVRLLRKSPGFSITAIFSLAIAIGANTAVFSLIDHLLLAKLGVADPDKLVAVERALPDGETESEFPARAFEELRDRNHVFSRMMAWASSRMSISLPGAPPEMIDAAFYSGDSFALLGVEPVLGRVLTAADDQPGRPAVAVISNRYWRSRLGGSPDALNRTIEAKGVAVTVVGVLPPGFTALSETNDYPDVTMPFVWQSRFALNDNAVHANIAARLADGVTFAQARAEMNVLFAHWIPELIDPATPPEQRRTLLAQTIQVRPAGRGNHDRWERYKLRLGILMGTVVLVLLIACANVASLMLARASARQHELAVRSAIGAGRFRLIQQLLTESLVVGAWSGMAGLALAVWIGSGLAGVLGLDAGVPLSGRVFGFTAVVSIGAVILFGLVPALRSSHPGLHGRKHAGRLRAARALVVAQVALGLVLVMGAGLLVRSIRNLGGVETGFDSRNVLLSWMYPTTLGYEGREEIELYHRLLDRFQAMHGVVQASMARHYLLQGAGNFDRVSGISAAVNSVAPGFFGTMRIPLLAGRDFSWTDEASGPKVAIVDARYAAERFGAESPLGKIIDLGGQRLEIVGMVANVRYYSLRQNVSAPEVFLPFMQAPRAMLGQMCFALRTAQEPMTLLPDARREAYSVEKNLPLVFPATQAEIAEQSMGGERSMEILTAVFAAIAVALACLGMFGVVAYSTARRTNEIGVRIALGASRLEVMRGVLRESAALVAIGLAIGLPLTLAATRLIRTWLFGVESNDPLTVVAAAFVMIAVAAMAGFIPARRAARVDPMVALRHE